MELFTVNGEYVCKARRGFTVRKLEEALGSQPAMRKGSFAGQYSLRIFRNLFEYARDLREEYEEFYREEYDSFPEFLYKKEFWERADLQCAGLTDEDTVLKLRIELSSYNMDNLFLYEESEEFGESMFDMIIQVLEGIDL